MATKAGYTKSGKSIKSVKRYYAMLNAGKQSADKKDDISKRIAIELQTTKDAAEKRGVPIEHPNQTTQPPAEPERSNKAAPAPAAAAPIGEKSVKSAKSTAPSYVARDVLDHGRNDQAFGYWEVYVVVLCLFTALNFLVAFLTNGIFWKVRDHSKLPVDDSLNPIVQTYEFTVLFGWAGLTVSIALCVWLKLREKIFINALCLIGMVTGLLIIIINFTIYAMARKKIKDEWYLLQWHDHVTTFFGLSFAVLIAFVIKIMVQQIIFIRRSSGSGPGAKSIKSASGPDNLSTAMA